ncbi:MAG: hypothetical protein Q9183_006611, partial [Haloplaca sp. 2 TL-2023]
DEIGKRGQQVKRNAVNIDGYESDSSNEGFNARADAKSKEAEKVGTNGAASKAEEDNDMFADLEEDLKDGDEDEELPGEGKRQKKNVRFLEADEIEGQVGNSKSGGHVSADFSLNGQGPSGLANGQKSGKDKEVDSSSESDVGDEERADVGEDMDEEIGAGGKKEHAPKLDAFNMKLEQEEGRFDQQGNYVRKAADPDAVHDSWLEGVSKKDMKKAKEAADKRDETRRLKNIEADSIQTSDVLNTLIMHLEKSETILEALARLGRGKEKKKPRGRSVKQGKRNGADSMDIDTEKPQEDPAETKRKKAIEDITDAADLLLTRGQAEVYDTERGMLMRQYTRATGHRWEDGSKKGADAGGNAEEKKQWEYRWLDGRDGGQANGPYDGAMMMSWNDAGYFGEGVEFRRADEGGDWILQLHRLSVTIGHAELHAPCVADEPLLLLTHKLDASFRVEEKSVTPLNVLDLYALCFPLVAEKA